MFIHGTGVRQPAYGFMFERFAKKIANIRPDYTVVSCYWGGPHGSRLNADGASIPSSGSHRGLDEELSHLDTQENEEIALWELLERDPLFEMRLLTKRWRSQEELPPNALPPGMELIQKARRLPSSTSVMSQAETCGLKSVLSQSIEAVLNNPITKDALKQAGDVDDTVHAPLARAFVAGALLRADEEIGILLPLDGPHRSSLIAAITAELGGTDRGIGSSLSRFGLNVAVALGATKPIERRRAVITEASAPITGDVLMYLARGEPIRNFIANKIGAIDEAVALVAHSLGGVASMELLATRTVSHVNLLITVGSQAPFLYELNALTTLEFGNDLPASFPRWINIFDRRDLLAFVGSSIFPGRVQDREVDCEAPFPRSHSAYFSNNGFYSILNEVLP